MQLVDWILSGVLLLSLLLGVWRGLVYEVLSVLSWIAAFALAQWFAPDVGQRLPMSGVGEPMRHVAGFVVVFIAVVFAGGLVALVVKKLVAVVGLSPVDRLLGALFGLARGLILLLAAAVVVAMTPLHSSAAWRQSVGAGVLDAALKGIKPALPDDMARYLP